MYFVGDLAKQLQNATISLVRSVRSSVIVSVHTGPRDSNWKYFFSEISYSGFLLLNSARFFKVDKVTDTANFHVHYIYIIVLCNWDTLCVI